MTSGAAKAQRAGATKGLKVETTRAHTLMKVIDSHVRWRNVDTRSIEGGVADAGAKARAHAHGITRRVELIYVGWARRSQRQTSPSSGCITSPRHSKPQDSRTRADASLSGRV